MTHAHICARGATSPCCTSRSPSFTSSLTKSLGAESFLYVNAVPVLVLSRLNLVLPTSWDDVGPRMGRTPVSRHRSRHTTVSPWSLRCGGFHLVYVRSRGRAPSLPPLQGWIWHRCTCMCPPVFPLAILLLHFVLSSLRQTLSHHGAANSYCVPMALWYGATALADQVGPCRRHTPDN